MIPLCSRFDSVLFTKKMPAFASYSNFSRSPKVSPEGEPPAKDKAKAGNAKSAKPVKKPVAQRSKPVKPAAHRSAKKDPKIAPFNGALSGLFTPGAPAKRN